MKKVKLTSVCRPKQWKSIPISELSDVGYPVYGANGVIGYYDSYNHEQETVIITCRGATCGTVNLTHPRSYVTGNAMCLDNVKDSVDIKYLFYSMQAYDFTKVISGTAQPQITRVGLEKVEITLPSLDVQREIVSILDKIDALIEQRRLQLKKLEELVKARFVEMFGNGHDGFCNTKKLGEFCKFQQGTQIPVEEQIEEQLEGYTRFLRIIDYTQAPQIPRYVSVKGREIAEDSVVIVRYGATAGFVGHGYAGILANNLFEVVPDESILSKDFLYLALKYGTFEQEVHDKAFGAAMPALSFGMMNDIGVVTPNSTAQNGFVDFVKQVDKAKLLSGCRLFHSWAPENRDKPKHVGVPQRKTKVLRGCQRQQ